MSDYHIVVQGEHLAGIAEQYGFTSYRVIWNHPNNQQLKSKRKNPNVLFPGDRVFIPDLKPANYLRNTDKTHKFRLKGDPLQLRLVLEDQYEKPVDSASCLLVIGTAAHRLTTDGKGKLVLPIPPSTHEASLVIQHAPQTPYDGVTIPVKVGDLDPVEEISGQQARLTNLGYFYGKVAGNSSPDFVSAVEEFQCDHGLKVDGKCGPVTQAKLKEVHGC